MGPAFACGTEQPRRRPLPVADALYNFSFSSNFSSDEIKRRRGLHERKFSAAQVVIFLWKWRCLALPPPLAPYPPPPPLLPGRGMLDPARIATPRCCLAFKEFGSSPFMPRITAAPVPYGHSSGRSAACPCDIEPWPTSPPVDRYEALSQSNTTQHSSYPPPPTTPYPSPQPHPQQSAVHTPL